MKKLTVSAAFLSLAFGLLDAQELENVQVLPFETRKDITEFMKNTVAKSLGVKCDFCHNPKDYSLDENHHKIVAREMMRLVGVINERMTSIQKVAMAEGMKHWEIVPEVDCWACHRGSKEPELAPPK